MSYTAIPLADESSVLVAIYDLIPEGTYDFPLDLDREIGDADLDEARLHLKAIRDEIEDRLFNAAELNTESGCQICDLVLEKTGIWVKLEKWKTSLNTKFNGWMVTDIRLLEDFDDITVDDITFEDGEANSKVVKFTVGGFGAEGYNIDYHDCFQEVLTSDGSLPAARDSSLLSHYPASVISLIHKQIPLGGHAA